jgi:hypothetical protein
MMSGSKRHASTKRHVAKALGWPSIAATVIRSRTQLPAVQRLRLPRARP